MTLRLLQCGLCKHYINPGTGLFPTCFAFPEGIPEEIFWNRVDHKKPYPGDNAIQFEETEWVKEILDKAGKAE